jgi:TPP-dependent pyruvate/acetoin dehydrogenase alpha subunit
MITKLSIFLNIYKKIKFIRAVENKVAEERKNNIIKGPVHLCIGQEAIASAVSEIINIGKNKDRVFGNHRSHAHLLSLGSNLSKFFAELLAKPYGLSKGFGGSMHLFDSSVGFFGSTPIVAGTIPIAIGSAFEQKYLKKKNITIVYFGDGATEEGVFHECLNLSKNYNIPIIFICENNYMASHMHISERQVNSDVSKFSKNIKIKTIKVDGNNVFLLHKEIYKLYKYCKKFKLPGFVEAKTYRWLGHVDWREDVDVGVKRSKSIIKYWKNRDPLILLEKKLIKKKILNFNKIKLIERNISKKILIAWKLALSKKCSTNLLIKNVYGN